MMNNGANILQARKEAGIRVRDVEMVDGKYKAKKGEVKRRESGEKLWI